VERAAAGHVLPPLAEIAPHQLGAAGARARDVGIGEGVVERGGDEHALAEARMALERDALAVDPRVAREFLAQLARAPGPGAQRAPVVLLARPAGKPDHPLLHLCGGVRLEQLRAVGDVGEAVGKRGGDAVGRRRAAEIGRAAAGPDVGIVDQRGGGRSPGGEGQRRVDRRTHAAVGGDDLADPLLGAGTGLRGLDGRLGPDDAELGDDLGNAADPVILDQMDQLAAARRPLLRTWGARAGEQRRQAERGDFALVRVGGVGIGGRAACAAAQIAEAEARALGGVHLLGGLRGVLGRRAHRRYQRQRGNGRGKPSTHRITPSPESRSPRTDVLRILAGRGQAPVTRRSRSRRAPTRRPCR
jgi:hypothetical protein